MEQKIFYNLNKALEYAKTIGVDTYSHSVSCDIRNNGTMITAIGEKAGFDIDGFSEVLPLIYVQQYEQSGEKYSEIRFRGQILHMIETDEYYYITRQDKDKYGLCSLKFVDTSYNTFSYFKTTQVAPQNIGKATRTKILNWVEYARTIEREKLSYWQERKDRRERVMKSVKAKYPSALWRTVGGAWNEYDFAGYEVTIEPKGSAIRIKYELDGCGSIGTSYSVNYTEASELSKNIMGE